MDHPICVVTLSDKISHKTAAGSLQKKTHMGNLKKDFVLQAECFFYCGRIMISEAEIYSKTSFLNKIDTVTITKNTILFPSLLL